MAKVPSKTSAGSKDRESFPRSVFLDPGKRQYPYKRMRDGKWQANCADLNDAIRVAGFQGRKDIIAKAQKIKLTVGCK